MSDDVIPADEVMRRLERAAAATPYPAEAYLFVLTVIVEQSGDISGAELCWGLREYILNALGGEALEQLASWSIHSTDDFGRMVDGLAEAELIRKSAEDTPDDFHDVYDFQRAFIRPRWFQWRLSTIFFVTIVSAIAFAGASRLGLRGAIFTLFGVWMSVIGVCCLALAARHRQRGRLLAFLFGIAFLAGGAALFVSVLLHA